VLTTRRDGSSPPPWDGLNVAGHVGDDPDRVAANRAALQVGIQPAHGLAWADQVHGADVAVVTGAGTSSGVDALVTRVPGLALAVQAADCLPVLLAEPVVGVVAAVHAGRQGLVAGVLQAAVQAMVDLGADPGRTSAVLGPAVCGACYELPQELADDVGAAVPGSRSTTRQGTPAVDLAAGAEALLSGLGVRTARVGGCTLEDPDRFFSFRRDGQTGRHAGLVWLE
jgi:YfiH family protein